MLHIPETFTYLNRCKAHLAWLLQCKEVESLVRQAMTPYIGKPLGNRAVYQITQSIDGYCAVLNFKYGNQYTANGNRLRHYTLEVWQDKNAHFGYANRHVYNFDMVGELPATALPNFTQSAEYTKAVESTHEAIANFEQFAKRAKAINAQIEGLQNEFKASLPQSLKGVIY